MPHPSQITPLSAPGVDSSRCGEQGEEFEASVKQEKVNSLNLSLKSVQKGIEETQVSIFNLGSKAQVMSGAIFTYIFGWVNTAMAILWSNVGFVRTWITCPKQ